MSLEKPSIANITEGKDASALGQLRDKLARVEAERNGALEARNKAVQELAEERAKHALQISHVRLEERARMMPKLVEALEHGHKMAKGEAMATSFSSLFAGMTDGVASPAPTGGTPG